jgi:hypothetical protein
MINLIKTIRNHLFHSIQLVSSMYRQSNDYSNYEQLPHRAAIRAAQKFINIYYFLALNMDRKAA